MIDFLAMEVQTMGKKTMKAAAMAAILGTVLQFGGCFGRIWQDLLTTGVSYAILEYVTDNDGVFDLFEGGNV
jgi:hypothetical protein